MSKHVMSDKQLADWVLRSLRLMKDYEKVNISLHYLRRLASLAKTAPKFDQECPGD